MASFSKNFVSVEVEASVLVQNSIVLNAARDYHVLEQIAFYEDSNMRTILVPEYKTI